MTEHSAQNFSKLSNDELAFQTDPINWQFGPTFEMCFFCKHTLDFNTFESALMNDPLRVADPRFDNPGQVLFRHSHWPVCVGARYYDFQQPNRREPSVIFYPKQYELILSTEQYSGNQVMGLRKFLTPIVSLAIRIKTTCEAHKVLLFFEDFYPTMNPKTEVAPSVFIAEPIFEAMDWSLSDVDNAP